MYISRSAADLGSAGMQTVAVTWLTAVDDGFTATRYQVVISWVASKPTHCYLAK